MPSSPAVPAQAAFAAQPYDVAIIGGGVCGCSLLYALSRYRLRVLLLEATNDVGVATTKANSAILHAGYDPVPGTRMARYNVPGNALARALCKRLDILMDECGSLVVGFGEEDRPVIEELYRQGVANGVPDLCVVENEELHRLEPALAPEARFGLYAPTAAVVNPWELAFAQAEVAVKNGAEVWLQSPVTALEKAPDGIVLHTPAASATARFVVNAAGVHADAVAQMLEEKRFTIYPSRGEYFLLDKSQHALARQVIFQPPSSHGKGVLVAPTVHGNLIVGPNAAAAHDTATTAEGLAFVKAEAQRSVPTIDFSQNIRNFAGLRAYSDAGDFIVEESPTVPGFFHMAGIKSPGLTAAMAIAQDVTGLLENAGLALAAKETFDDTRRVIRFKHLSAAEKEALIRQNPAYGRIVCRCESITEGEILDALRRPLPPRSLDAVKRRVGPGMGRCQGGFCGPRVLALLAEWWGVPKSDIPQDDAGSQIVLGPTKDPALLAGAACPMPGPVMGAAAGSADATFPPEKGGAR